MFYLVTIIGEKMNSKVYIRQLSRIKWLKNETSGHEWREETLLDLWEVVGRYGVVATCKTFQKAEKIAKDYQAFYDKYDFN